MSGWVLAVDFGTSNTAAAVCEVGEPERARTVKLASASTEMPSGVLVHRDGHLLVGEVARNSAAAHPPQHYNPTPKRNVGQGQVPLAGKLRSDVELVAAVLRGVAERAARHMGGSAPSQLRLTHPATWRALRTDVLRQAAVDAELPEPLLVAEPVAAATYYTCHDKRGAFSDNPHAPVAVYDIGGGTVDIAVLEPAADGTFAIRAVSGVDPLGGELFDERLLELVGEALQVRGRDELWERFQGPGGLARRRTLHDEVRRAKHTLSEQSSADVAVTAGDDSELVTLTREQFHRRITPDLTPSLSRLDDALHTAGTTPQQLAALYLAGGSSFTPLVHDLIHQHLTITPQPFDDPKTITALGALHVPSATPRRTKVVAEGRAEGPAEVVIDLKVPALPGEPLVDHWLVSNGGKFRRGQRLVQLQDGSALTAKIAGLLVLPLAAPGAALRAGSPLATVRVGGTSSRKQVQQVGADTGMLVELRSAVAVTAPAPGPAPVPEPAPTHARLPKFEIVLRSLAALAGVAAFSLAGYLIIDLLGMMFGPPSEPSEAAGTLGRFVRDLLGTSTLGIVGAQSLHWAATGESMK